MTLHRVGLYPDTLTDLEAAVLPAEYNLADGHAYRACNASEQALLDGAAQRFRHVDRRRQEELETAYFDAFHILGGQTLDTKKFRRFPCFTASSGIEIIANYLRLTGKSVLLIEPCFDNLPDILRRHRIPLSVFPDHLLEADGDVMDAFLEDTTADALFIVSPNNPTGSVVTRDNFARILRFCERRGVTLILDACFRFYLPDGDVYDQYAMLAAAGIDCIVIEDTGKTWPTVEIKAPFIAVSEKLIDPIARINSDFLLHVSPFAISLLTDFVNLSIADGRGHIRSVVAANRAALSEALDGTFLDPGQRAFMSVSWLKIGLPISARALTARLSLQEVHVLPGDQFFWSDDRLGSSFIRVALVRDLDTFAQAASRLGQACRGAGAQQAW